MKAISLVVLSLLLVVSLACTAAINYSITFTGSGSSTIVGDVVVQNLTKGTTVTVPAGNVLNLSVVESTAVEQLNANDETISVCPNTVGGASTLSFFAKQAGSTQINIYNLVGRKIVSINQILQSGINSFRLLLPNGSYAIQVIGNKYTYSAKMINQSASPKKTEIVFLGNELKRSSNQLKSKSSNSFTTSMNYSIGDRLLYVGTSGNYSTALTDVPSNSKTINFEFEACTDADGNNYTIVKIGTQTWMAENLKSTKYNDGTSIPNVTDNAAWASLTTSAYCWYNNDATSYKDTYGALYNWHTVNTGKLAPVGWHVPADAEWTTLENYLMSSGSNYDGTTTGNKYAKALAATINWPTNTYIGAVGNNLSKNNSSAFSALPGGSRSFYNGEFRDLGSVVNWWTATQGNVNDPWGRGIASSAPGVSRYWYTTYKTTGFSVRCIRD